MSAPDPAWQAARVAARFDQVGEIEIDPDRAVLHEDGWQSWTPTSRYRVGQRPWRGLDPVWNVMQFRGPDFDPAPGFSADGMLAVDPGTGGPVRVWAATDPTLEVATIRAERRGDRLVVTADGPVLEWSGAGDGAGDLDAALGGWASGYAAPLLGGPIRPAPTIWCSWYHYFTEVSEADMVENLDALDRLDLPVDVVQLDDGYQSELGDWLTLSDRFESLGDLVARIRDRGRRAGIWVAPFLVGVRSELAREHPDWLVRGADPGAEPAHAGHNWKQDLYALDTSHPGAAAYLTEVFATLAGLGVDFFKIDFVYAGALPGRRHRDVPATVAYREGLQLIRSAIGESYLLGCGAPILPSIGLVDGMRRQRRHRPALRAATAATCPSRRSAARCCPAGPGRTSTAGGG